MRKLFVRLNVFRRTSFCLNLSKRTLKHEEPHQSTDSKTPSTSASLEPPEGCNRVRLKRSANVSVRYRRCSRNLLHSGSIKNNRPVPGAADQEYWWYKVGRETAERLLLQANQPKGGFLLHPSSGGLYFAFYFLSCFCCYLLNSASQL